ncbi:redoxin domain-containing protein [Sphingomonas changnyeongensis]|uniref:thioredoxin-dependent peroxiredoxin n=1 Tax=Sphingomonas changnyeongensis TaxID=2698679 RepID=A0A7Z2NUC9_9SPHN|nr:peroxiredoxin [Sphingomonas changnyeongensis]QHL89604.1 redoxin domain-containing protein [Sphingomonas changnyeongensis]
MVQVGDMAPEAAFEAMDGAQTTLAAWRGRKLVLYFYPKDDTPGCTKEAQAFSELAAAFDAAGTAILGVSKDSAKKHQSFTAKYGLSFPLATDTDNALLEAFGAWVEKSMYGKTYMGIDRSTFLIDAEGRIARIWRKVKVPGHAAEVLAAAQAL